MRVGGGECGSGRSKGRGWWKVVEGASTTPSTRTNTTSSSASASASVSASTNTGTPTSTSAVFVLALVLVLVPVYVFVGLLLFWCCAIFPASKIKRLSTARCVHGCAQPRRPSHIQSHHLAPEGVIALSREQLQELAFAVLALALALAHADRGADAQLGPAIVGELLIIPDEHAGVRGLRKS